VDIGREERTDADDEGERQKEQRDDGRSDAIIAPDVFLFGIWKKSIIHGLEEEL
jgi:hypothetical protein